LRSMNTGDLDARFLLHSIVAWGISGLIFLCIASLLMLKSGLGENAVGYINSVLSFLTAVAAGAAAGKSYRGGAVYAALLAAAVIVTALLTVGFIVEGTAIESAGVISVVSFSFAGCLFGSVFLSGLFKKDNLKRQRRN